ncbi:hypothetical protein Golob_006428 [Gossypium lobatum]|uniref:DUF4283 domain-containing protein n=1 Tax=Gossypium lobatum TaxID=34289 RepID=A0A7J8MW91_9ROSI|nr:hypothetical protein [Gossypium lobatum]
MEKDEIFLLKEELVQLSVKSFLVVPKENPSLLCSGEEDLKMNMEGHPWFFRQQLIIFYHLVCHVERSKIKTGLLHSPFWLKVGLCPPEL